MTPRQAVHAMAFFLIPVLCAGCLEIGTTTTVHRDGSLRRALIIKGDSAAIYGGQYTVPIDTTWSQKIRQIEERKFEFTRLAARAGWEATGPGPLEEEIIEAVKGTREALLGER